MAYFNSVPSTIGFHHTGCEFNPFISRAQSNRYMVTIDVLHSILRTVVHKFFVDFRPL